MIKKAFVALFVVAAAGAATLLQFAPDTQEATPQVADNQQEKPSVAPTTPASNPERGSDSPRTSSSASSKPGNKKQLELSTPAGKVLRPNLVYRALYTPVDQPSSQWYITRIAAPQAWDKTTGSPTTKVAVIDTGFGLSHDELSYRWAANSGEVGSGKESNGIDDDGNGYVDDWRGWDFYHQDNAPNAGVDNATGASVSHGTSVAGLVGAAGDNGVGIASINWQTQILPLQALNDDGVGYSETVAEAMHYAVNRGVDVINLSLGTSAPDDIIKAEVDYAVANNVLVVAAAGNNGCDCMVYPANYPDVLSVGATDQNDVVAYFSSYGTNLDVVAPGTGTIVAPLWSAANTQSGYSTQLHGTSFAAPIVSGLAALVKSAEPSLTAPNIANYIKNQTDVVPGMSQPEQAIKYGTGRVNAYKSVIAANAALPTANQVATAPLYRLYKPGASDQYTVLIDRRDELRLYHGYQYEIHRLVRQ